ncbi:uncharacterized protein Z519_02906 [Cladophialophora bantiana CBS 173.52]|uniref:RNA binding protein Jsn1 n=1 Tax=Cladophialophora bantiana (strain ATCC 10958 / CBS 173.52 / CDC B-1940 / NIH 8579) TaxID=1442370 RepID=A0A0D2GB87_CLAB1|nr:uncharacterized protein Z519_02906 [Cladophialophora bantiana CBS 173.52]KIW95842.1 hypothetical protein Z519_02906 [Cladophialophora bantiana CBS 173.52]
MAPPTSTRPDGQLNINLSGLTPISEPPSVPTSKSPFGGAKSSSGLAGLSNARVGAGSPLHEQASRLFPKRTRELQSQTSLTPNIWGPPTSGTSTPLFEIPESPNQDGFPDLVPLTETGINSPARRGRAGTLPSRISPVGTINGVNVLTSKTSRPTPSTSPFRPGSTSAAETAFYSTASNQANPGTSALLSRLRAGSMPQRSSLLGPSGPFGQNAFSSSWGTRTRAATLTSISSADDPMSPQPSGYSKDGMSDSGVRTLDYLGLAEPPQHSKPDNLRQVVDESARPQDPNLSDVLAGFGMRNSSRFRSFSVNTQSKYATEAQEGGNNFPLFASGTLTPSAAAALEAEYELVQEKVRLHNQAVQAFAVNASAARPRARTAGLVETPQRTSLRNLAQPSADNLGMAFDMQGSSAMDQSTLADTLQNLSIAENVTLSYEGVDESEVQVSRSLWIGSIPNSTTMSSLDAIFNRYGPIESTRVLTHKNCGFVNFESVEHAVRARQLLNGKEIFPGAGPVRIGFAKAPNASVSLTPVQNATPPPGANGSAEAETSQARDATGSPAGSMNMQQTLNLPAPDRLTELQPEILQIVLDFGGQQSDLPTISANIESAIRYNRLEKEIAPIPEPSSTRMYDAPRLRDIRKRIDNGACGLQEIEQIAIDMLPEIAELSSDYLGNTVVQKLFEYCSEQTKEQMLTYIAPHLAEIGVHKNGTWAAQKIIEVCKTETQTRMIVDSLRPYTIPLFLDQYGNYVLQCCLRFGPPYNDYIFETMLSQLWEIAQGRFGARAMRACLEAHHATKNQQRMMAAAIALHSVQLAQNANGALLLTWLLDTCTFPRRRSVLAPRLIPHLVQLCTHKVAYLTVLKVINQRNEPDARDMVLNALFFSPNDAVLEQILCDQTSGVTLIFKILTTPFLDDNMRPEVVQNVSKVLTKIKAQPNQGYKRIMDEVGLSSRPSQPAVQQYPSHGHPNVNDRTRPLAQQQQVPLNGMQQQNFSQRQYSGSFVPNGSNFENGLSPIRTGSADSFGFAPYTMNGFQSQQQYSQLTYQQMTPQAQYQSFPAAAPPQRSNGGYMPNGFAGYVTPPAAIDPFRPLQNPSSSPLSFSAQMSPVIGSSGFPPQNFQQNMPSNMYNYPQQQFFFSPPMQTVHSGGRGRRVCAIFLPL